MAWIGGGTAGMRLKLKGAERHWDDPMWNGVETIDGVPRSWGGDHKDGGCRISPASVHPQAKVLLECASGALSLKAGETITYRFDLLITPFKQPDVAEHFAQRTLQIGYPMAAMSFYDWTNITEGGRHQSSTFTRAPFSTRISLTSTILTPSRRWESLCKKLISGVSE